MMLMGILPQATFQKEERPKRRRSTTQLLAEAIGVRFPNRYGARFIANSVQKTIFRRGLRQLVATHGITLERIAEIAAMLIPNVMGTINGIVTDCKDQFLGLARGLDARDDAQVVAEQLCRSASSRIARHQHDVIVPSLGKDLSARITVVFESEVRDILHDKMKIVLLQKEKSDRRVFSRPRKTSGQKVSCTQLLHAGEAPPRSTATQLLYHFFLKKKTPAATFFITF